MAIKFFGHHLVDEGKLTKEQLIDVAMYQDNHNLTLGDLAVEEKMITQKEAEKINIKQRVWDKRFGEVAVELGLLDDKQVDALLKKQKSMKVFFGEVVVLKGFMTQEELDAELEKFNNIQKSESEQINEDIDKFEKSDLIHEVISTLEKLYFRVFHDNIKLNKFTQNSNVQNAGVIAVQKMRGDEHFDFALQVNDNVALHMASYFLKMPFTKIDEDVEDVVMEFVNIVLGNIAVSLSNREVVTNLTPPQIVNAQDINGENNFYFNFSTTKGDIALVLKM